MMPAEPTVEGYCVLAIGAACYLAIAMLWHWTYGKPPESQDEIERRTQFSRDTQRIQEQLDREKIEEWKQYREAVKQCTWNNMAAPTFQQKFDKAMLEARESIVSERNEADEWLGESLAADYKRRHDELIELIRSATQKERDKVSKALKHSLWGDPGHAKETSHSMGAASFPYVLSAPSMSLMPGEYRNPFHFLDEFDKWFEFQSRKRFCKERTHDIIKDMLKNDIERARKAYDSSNHGLGFDVMCDFGVQVLHPKTILIKPDFT